MPSIKRWATLPIAAIIIHPLLTNASPFPTQLSNALANRACENPCGHYSQLCCTSSQECGTENGQAVCRPAAAEAANGQWEYFTTTYVQTDFVTVTSTGSSLFAAPTSDGQCKSSLGETKCGDICCSAAEACSKGKCVRSGATPLPSRPGASATAPLRPTSSGGATVTATESATATLGFIPAVGTDGSRIVGITTGNGGLSGGAIAGIVVGSLAGAFILFLLCFCFCVGGFIDRVRSLLGLRRKKPSHSSYTGSSSYTSGHSRPWFGRSDSGSEKKSGFFGLGKWASIGVIIGAITLCLGLKRRHSDDSEKTPTSYYGSSYYTGPSSSSSSSSSSGRRH